MDAELVFINGNVITVDDAFSIQQAIAVKDGWITAVGSNEAIQAHSGLATQIIDLAGKTIMPGINDSHMHAPFFGATRPPLALDLTITAVSSIADIVAAVADKVRTVPPGEWIRGFGWDPGGLKECQADISRLPRKWDLDAVSPDNPVLLTDFSGHTQLANSKAMELAGISPTTPDPVGGEIERTATGEPTGIFKEHGATRLIVNKLPPLSRDEQRTTLHTTLQYLAANGITSFTDAAIRPDGSDPTNTAYVDLYQELLQSGELTARVTVLIAPGGYGAQTYADFERGLRLFHKPTGLDETWLQFNGMKIFADGIPLTYTSWMNEEYVSGDAGYGRSVLVGETDEEQRQNLAQLIEMAHKRRLQVAVHATGDHAIDATVDAFVKAVQDDPAPNLRHYVIHADFISEAKAKLLAQHGFGVAMQPTIKAQICDFEIDIVGAERAAYEWPTRTVWDAGVPLTFSSDAPITYPNWRQGIQDAVLREGVVSGKVSGAEQRVTVTEAIRAYTINGAWQDGMERVKGSIEVGKVADFCVVDRDPLTAVPHEIGSINVLLTCVGGRIVFDKGSFLMTR